MNKEQNISMKQFIFELKNRLKNFEHKIHKDYDNTACWDILGVETQSGNIYKFYVPNTIWEKFMIDFSPLYKGTIEEFSSWKSALGYFVEQVENENV